MHFDYQVWSQRMGRDHIIEVLRMEYCCYYLNEIYMLKQFSVAKMQMVLWYSYAEM